MKQEVIYAKASVERKPECRQQTLILQDGKRRWVRKIAVGKAAQEHLGKYEKNYEALTASLLPGHTVDMITCQENEDGSVDFPFLTDQTLGERLCGKDTGLYLQTVHAFRQALTDSFETEPFQANEAFQAFFGIIPDALGETALKVANADLNFDNVFCDSRGCYTIIDYEWVLPFPIPVSFLMYRALMLDPAYNAFSESDRKCVLEGLGISEGLEGQYHEMEMAFLAFISPDEEKLDYFARIPGARTNTVYPFAYLTGLPEENRKLSEDLSRELNNAVFLSGELDKAFKEMERVSGELEREVSTAVSLSEELAKEQATSTKLSDELERVSGELEREVSTAVSLSEELAKEQAASTRLSNELAKQLALYNEFASKIWFRAFRKLGRIWKKVKGALKRVAEKNRFLLKCWNAAAYLYHYGPVAFTQKLIRRGKAQQAESRYVERLVEESESPAEEQTIPQTVRFSILVPLYNTPEVFLREMIQSVVDQTYSNWELCLADGSDSQHGEVGAICTALAKEDARILYRRLERNEGISENTNACIDMATGDYIALFDHDDLLHPSALYENAKAIYETGADFLYSDEVVFASPDKSKLIATHFKPDYSPESLLSNNYICHLSVFKRTLLNEAGAFRREYDGSQDHDIILRLTACAQNVVHIPKVLYFWRSHPTSVASDISTKTYAVDAGRNAVRDFLKVRKDIDALVESTPEYPTMYHVRFPFDKTSRVSVILDWSGKDIEQMWDRLKALQARTRYTELSFVVLSDDAGAPGDALGGTAFDNPIAWIKADGRSRPERLNEAVRASDGSYIVFLDAELEPMRDDWIEEMIMLAQQDHVGAVGGKVYFEDNVLRQAGLIMGLGANRLVGRSHFRVEQGNGGYFGQLSIAGNVSALSTECMMLRRDRFEAAGGFDTDYEDTLFDVDLCLRLLKAGYRNIYTPFSLFKGGRSGDYRIDYGIECKDYPHDSMLLRGRWKDAPDKSDPYYNPNLTLDHSDYRIREDRP